MTTMQKIYLVVPLAPLAGAIIAGGKGTAAEKMAALTAAGVRVVKSPADMGAAVKELLT